jgi:hypothetical protein
MNRSNGFVVWRYAPVMGRVGRRRISVARHTATLEGAIGCALYYQSADPAAAFWVAYSTAPAHRRAAR